MAGMGATIILLHIQLHYCWKCISILNSAIGKQNHLLMELGQLTKVLAEDHEVTKLGLAQVKNHIEDDNK